MDRDNAHLPPDPNASMTEFAPRGTLLRLEYRTVNLDGRAHEADFKEKLEGLRKELALWEDVLSKSPYLAGDEFTLADVAAGKRDRSPVP